MVNISNILRSNQVLWNELLDKSLRPLIFGHRGMGTSVEGGLSHYVENSIESFIESLKRGCDGVELDVFLTNDNQLAVIHGTEHGDMGINIKGRCGLIESYSGSLSELPLKLPESITNYGHLLNKTPSLPTLESVLDAISGYNKNVFVNIELKGTKRELGLRVLDLLKGYRIPFLISSFNYDINKIDMGVNPRVNSLIDLVDNDLGIPLGLLVYEYMPIDIEMVLLGLNIYQARWVILSHKVEVKCPETGVFVSISSQLARSFVDHLHRHKVLIGVYMADHYDDGGIMENLISNDMDLLIVNDIVNALYIKRKTNNKF